MQRVLFNSTIFGPIHSRRLGTSLGVNLMPNDGKVCSFDCLYCEAGFNAQGPGASGFPSREQVRDLLRQKLSAMRDAGEPLDVITFSGNGEPTLHHDFAEIIDDVIALRDEYYPDVKISVLSNATRIDSDNVFNALLKVDNNIQKLDSATNETARKLDRPNNPAYDVEKIARRLENFGGHCIVQTMFVRGEYEGVSVDNTSPEEVEALVKLTRAINPSEVMIYTIDRKTPAEHLVRISREEMERIADKYRAAGLKVQVSA